MQKMKQATLFSLKSWKTKPEDLLVYKKRLEKKNLPDTVVLKTLALLIYFNRESILSTGIDEIIKLLCENANMKIAMEAKRLLAHWNLNVSQAKLDSDSSKVCEIKMDTEVNLKKSLCNSSDIGKTVQIRPSHDAPSLSSVSQAKYDSDSSKVCEIKMDTERNQKKSLCNSSDIGKTVQIRLSPSLRKPLNETYKNEQSIAVVPRNTWVESKVKGICVHESQSAISNNSDLLEKETSNKGMFQVQQPSCLKINKKSLCKSEIKAMRNRIETISKIFIETFGKQQVEHYLEQQLI